MKRFFLIALLFFTLIGCETQVDPRDTFINQDALMNARTLVRETNVGVRVDLFTQVFGGFFERSAGNAQGSGVIFFEDDDHYYVLTNFHVVNPRDFDRASYQLSVASGDTAEADLYVYDEAMDLAVLKFPKLDLDLKVMDLSHRYGIPLTPGEFLLAVGNPSAINSIVTYGEFMNLMTIQAVEFSVILHNALIFPGNSGGALTDINGRLVGINTWRFESGEDRNLAIPLDIIKLFLESHDLWP